MYGLVCPIKNVVRYIGKTNNPQARLLAHLTTAKCGRGQHHNARWIRKLLAQGLRPALRILAEVGEGERWQDVERRLIAEAKAAGIPLTNTTPGGDAPVELSPEVRARAAKKCSASMKKAWADPEKRRRYVDAMRAPETIQRKREVMRTVLARQGAKQKISVSVSRFYATPEGRALASARAIKMHANPEQSARRLQSIRAAAKRPQTRQRLATAMAEVFSRADVRKKMSAASKSIWNDPTYREKVINAPYRHERMSAGQKARFADPIKRATFLNDMNAPARTAKLSAAMSRRNADPEFRTKVSGPEVRARAAATLKATWARRRKTATKVNEQAA